MEQPSSPMTPGPSPGALQRRSGWKAVSLSLSGLVVIAAVFMIGLNVGDGRLKLNLLHSQTENPGLPASLNYSTVQQVYDSLKQNYDGKVTETQLEDGLKHGLADATGDPYTVYFTPKEAQDFNSQLNNSFSGIGAELGQDKNGTIQVIAPIAGLPADKAGLKAQDLITQINGQTTSGESVDDAVNKIRGKKGTKVTLQIVRDHSQALSITITRDDIKLPSAKSQILDGNIGYLQISNFADDTATLSQKAADQFKQAGVKGIIVDLRENPGGLVTGALSVSSLWLQPGQTVFTSKGTDGSQTNAAQIGSGELHGIPTVVLVDGGSASAAEITIGALHDNHAAYVIGEKSFGKGVEQSLINFNDGSQLKVTIASWYRPNGQNINHKGITPDKTVKEPSDATAMAANDAQFQAALTYLNSK